MMKSGIVAIALTLSAVGSTIAGETLPPSAEVVNGRDVPLTLVEIGAAGVPGLAASHHETVAPGAHVRLVFAPGNPCLQTVQTVFADGGKGRGEVDFCKVKTLRLTD